MSGQSGLVRSITMPQGIALYVGAVVGAGVLILPGVAASLAGPGSLIAWAFDCLLGLPLALTFAALASRFPDAGGVATFASRAFGSGWGAVVGWFYFFASATGQVIVPLTGAYYATAALGWGREATFLAAGAILAAAVGANLRGLRLSGRLQLLLSGGVALVLMAAAVAALPRVQVENLLPLFPNGIAPVGRAAVLLFFALFGWEAIAQLSAEFRDPARDVPRSTVWSAVLVTLLYMGVAFAVVATGTYGDPTLDRVAVAQLLADSIGLNAGVVASGTAVLISLGTANAFVAATSRLGYALGRDGAFPAWMSQLSRRQVPAAAVLAVGGFAATGLALSYVWGWDAEKLMVVPNSLGIATPDRHRRSPPAAVRQRPPSGSGRFCALLGHIPLCRRLGSSPGAGGHGRPVVSQEPDARRPAQAHHLRNDMKNSEPKSTLDSEFRLMTNPLQPATPAWPCSVRLEWIWGETGGSLRSNGLMDGVVSVAAMAVSCGLTRRNAPTRLLCRKRRG